MTSLELPPAIPEGVRNDRLTRFAGLLRRYGLGEDGILVELRQMNSDRCRPALGDQEVRSIAHSVAKYPPAGPLVTWGHPPRNLIEVARRRGFRLVDSVAIVDLRRLLFTVGGRRGGGPFRVHLASPSGPACACRWFNNPTNETGTCAHVEACRAYVRLRYRPLGVGRATG